MKMTSKTHPLIQFSNFRTIHPIHYLVYITLYIITGFIFQNIGIILNIAKFNKTYQIFTCYGLYLVPISILIRHLDWKYQYLVTLFFMGWLEMLGYSRLHEFIPNIPFSVAFNNNIIDLTLGPRNFSLFMAMGLSPLIPVLNAIESLFSSLLIVENETDNDQVMSHYHELKQNINNRLKEE